LQRKGLREVRLVEGGRGIFEIRSDGRVLYSKQQTGRFPTDPELDALVPDT
jgi:predicted Rdx family selenoprotein